VTTMLKDCKSPMDVLDVFEAEVEAFDPFNYGAAGAKLLALHKSKAPHKREALPRSRLTRFLAGMEASLGASPAAPPIGVLASMGRAAAELGLETPEFWDRLSAAALPQIARAAKPKDVAMLSSAVCKAGRRDAQLMEAMGERFASGPQRYTVIEVQMLAAAMADTGVIHAAAADAVERRMVAEGHRLLALTRPKPLDVAVAASAVAQAARLGRLGSDVFPAFRPFVLAQARRMGPRELSSVASAYAATGRLDLALPVVKECVERLCHPQRLEAATPTDATVAARALAAVLEGVRASATRAAILDAAPGGAEAGAEAGAGGSGPSLAEAGRRRADNTERARLYLGSEDAFRALSKVMVRHMDPAAAGRDAMTLGLADAKSGKGRAGPFRRYPTRPPSPVHCLHALEAARACGAALSEEAAAKIADSLARSTAGLRPTEAARALRLVAAAAPPKRAAPAMASLVRAVATGRYRALDADPVAAASVAVSLVPAAGSPSTAAALTSRLAPRDRAAEPLAPSTAASLDAASAPATRQAFRRAAARAFRSVALRGTTLTVKQRAAVAWAAGTSRVRAPEAMAATALSLGRWTEGQRSSGIVAPTVLGLASSGHPCWADARSALASAAEPGGRADIVAAGLCRTSLTPAGDRSRTRPDRSRWFPSESEDWAGGRPQAGEEANEAPGLPLGLAVDYDGDGESWAGLLGEPEDGPGPDDEPAWLAKERSKLERFWAMARLELLSKEGGEPAELRVGAAAWLRRAVSRQRTSAMHVAAVAWSLAAGAAPGESHVPASLLIDGLRLGADGPLPGGAAAMASGDGLPPRMGPGETVLAAEAALLAGGGGLLDEVTAAVPWLRAVLAGARKETDRLRAPLASGALAQDPLRRSMMPSSGWEPGHKAALAAAVGAVTGAGQWRAASGGVLGRALTADVLLGPAGGGRPIAVVCETPRSYWSDGGLLPAERARRRLLRSLTGAPLVRVDGSEVVRALADGRADEVGASLVQAAETAARERR